MLASPAKSLIILIMLYALRVGLTLAVTIIVIQFFLPTVAAGLVELITKVIDILLFAVNQTKAGLPQ